MDKRLWHVAQAVAGLAILGFAVRQVARHWQDVTEAQLAWVVAPAWLGGGLVTVVLVFALLADGWRRVVQGWGFPLGWRDGARIWLLSSMAKYVPGKVWALAGMAVMGARQGIAPWATTGSAILLQVLSFATAALVVALVGQAALPVAVGPVGLVVLGAGLLGVSAVVLWRPLVERVAHRLAPAAQVTALPSPGALLYGALVNLLAWLGYGTAFWLFARGTLPDATLPLASAIGAYTASYVAGILAPFAPGGLGVREGVLVLALQPQVGLAHALALAAVSRLGMTFAELLASLLVLLRLPGHPRVESLHS